MTIVLLILFAQTGRGITGTLFVGAAYAQTPIICNVVMDDEEEESPEFWEEFFKSHLDDEETDEEIDEEPNDEEEVAPEEENLNDEESEDEDEWNPDEEGFLDFLNEGKNFEDEENNEIDNPPAFNEESSETPNEEYSPEPESMYDNESWSQVPGTKIPFFFLIDESASEMDEYLEPKVAHLKALKYADQMINGISFKYNVESGSVYLAENMIEIPEYIYMVDRFDYAGVSRFNYEVSIPSDIIESKISGRMVSVVAQVKSSNIASSFEASRKSAFMEAVKKAYIKEKLFRDPDNNTEFTGTINAWQVINEGWKSDEGAFFLQMNVWVSFNKT